MRILTTITYYSPHISGLTVYARRLVRRLVDRGHEVTVLTSRYDPDLPKGEEIDGARIVRSPVALRLSKGVLAPRFLWDCATLARQHDVVHVHLPQFEASGVAAIARAARRPVVATYHCDIELPRGPARMLFTPAIRLSHYLSGKVATRIVVNTEEYGKTARLPAHFPQKVVSVYPPIELAGPSLTRDEFRSEFDLGPGPLAGFVGRYAEEKGLEYLLDALPQVRATLPDARFVLAGPTDTVPGEHVHEWLRPKVEALGDAVVHVGLLSDEDLSAFYQAIDVLALPSTNSTESFGMTQAEAMLMGTPVVASDISGVREAVQVSGMGMTFPARDARALARAIVTVLCERDRFVSGASGVRELFDPEKTARFYEGLFANLTSKGRVP